ncbi:MAG: DUF2889 domain-containing protein [Syntrophaceae bacterium]|nr:DUF2889 domain-containing protein [Syntrophaceae bacterium]
MLVFGKPRGEKYHTRTIETTSYDYDERRFVVEGCLTDYRFKDYHLATGEERSGGILHQMIVCLLVNKASLEIEDLQVEMPVIPRDECLETIDCLDPVKGMKIVGGFSAKVKDIAGGTKGCNHLVALLTAMGPSVMQGYGAYHDHRSPNFLAENFQILMNTCRTWREDGPLVGILEDKRKAGKG